LGVLDRAFDVRARDLLAATDRRHAMAGHGLEVAACDTYPCGPHLDACHALSVRYRLLDGHYGALEVHDHALAQAVGGHGSFADEVEDAVLGHLADDGADLGRADVEADDDPLVAHWVALPGCSLISGGDPPGVDSDVGAAVTDER